MTIEKQKVIDQINVSENGIVFYREATLTTKDGVQLSQTYHRTSLIPGQDLTGQPAEVVAIANTAWTPEIITAYKAATAAQGV